MDGVGRGGGDVDGVGGGGGGGIKKRKRVLRTLREGRMTGSRAS